MPRIYMLFLCLLTPLAQGTENSHDLAYSLGVKLGDRLRDEVPGLELNALIEGLRQAYENEPLALSRNRIEALLNEHEASLAQPSLQIDLAQAAERRFLALEKGRPGVTVLSDGILLWQLRTGNGPKPSPNSKVRVRYIGLLPDGSQFDETQTPQWFSLESVIAGWQKVLIQMPVGSHWKIIIPSALAYGEEGAGDVIEPYTPLVFDLELIDTRD
ncbi:FKBP-type peptidyl-prolyl cis-trans isomerase [Pseudomonas sp. TTU2014-080ASC]|uniref:FKBP-type peptidyl-prolyl cis-trans isomerase n=1 Tax=Pseudomonas sp. TTU2014-080ASC TaxID=1729724 RepID=UPI0007188083|nr:FKBP-type peptidyl-prolyl cis-trans isomerase [Pseudomonas sp. TTU2014-080ASC]KRW61362.1 peptidylprolyl isomerase [Pseudomonas sp. TTU2014-080ASC]